MLRIQYNQLQRLYCIYKTITLSNGDAALGTSHLLKTELKVLFKLEQLLTDIEHCLRHTGILDYVILWTYLNTMYMYS